MCSLHLFKSLGQASSPSRSSLDAPVVAVCSPLSQGCPVSPCPRVTACCILIRLPPPLACELRGPATPRVLATPRVRPWPGKCRDWRSSGSWVRTRTCVEGSGKSMLGTEKDKVLRVTCAHHRQALVLQPAVPQAECFGGFHAAHCGGLCRDSSRAGSGGRPT